MDVLRFLRKNAFFFAITGAVVFWSLLGIAIYLHPGFSFFSPNQSLSDLGMIGAKYAYIFNLAIIITSVMYFLAIIGILETDIPLLRKIAIYVFVVALFAYVGIALNPKGTPLHVPLALTFFGLSSVAIFIWSGDMLRKKSHLLGLVFIALVISSYFVYYNYKIFGFPFSEAYAGAIIMAWVLTTAKIIQKNEN